MSLRGTNRLALSAKGSTPERGSSSRRAVPAPKAIAKPSPTERNEYFNRNARHPGYMSYNSPLREPFGDRLHRQHNPNWSVLSLWETGKPRHMPANYNAPRLHYDATAVFSRDLKLLTIFGFIESIGFYRNSYGVLSVAIKTDNGSWRHQSWDMLPRHYRKLLLYALSMYSLPELEINTGLECVLNVLQLVTAHKMP